LPAKKDGIRMGKKNGRAPIEFMKRIRDTLACAGVLLLVVFNGERVGLVLFAAKKRKKRKAGNGGLASKSGTFLDVENQSGWIAFLAVVSAVASGSVLVLLWLEHLVARYWFVTVPAAVVMATGLIFTPTPAGDYGGEGVGS
jgi:hypothetical protein